MPGDAPYQFVDSNIVVYAHDLSAGVKNRRARELIESLWESRTGCLSIQVLQEFYVTVTQKVPTPLEPVDASRIINDLLFWRVHEPRSKDVLEAMSIQQHYQISFWDAMIIQSAIQLGCQVIWSEDLKSEQLYEGIRLANPFHSLSENNEVNP
ncbi:MAG: twitching motility protein PilT [Chloroflexi bacterium RBG_16_54_18]|nr:MAG: twitching motility protein PilT [Chloroflexi bacterium RBG_16_54_18]